MNKLQQPFRFLYTILMVIIFLFVTGLLTLVIRDRWKRTRAGIRFLTYMSRATLWGLGVQVNPIGIEAFQKEGNALMAGNHLSYIDVLAISSNVTSCFVTSVEIKETPLLGHLCMGAGCLFVERRNKQQIHREIGELADGLARGLNVTIFPEATSTNHEQILRFRRPLFLSAGQAGRPIIPMCINYRLLGKETISVENRDRICWYGDMPFASHLWSLCGLGRIEADLVFLPAMHPTKESDIGELAEKSQKAVESVFRPVQKASLQA